MSESLWNDIDERLKSQLNTCMGTGSAFATLKLRSVEASILTDPQTWGDREFPFAIVDGRIEEMKDGQALERYIRAKMAMSAERPDASRVWQDEHAEITASLSIA